MHSIEIELLKRDLKLTDVQREILVGILLGDGCLESQNKGRTYRLKIEQSARHEAYVRHLYQCFRPWILSEPVSKRCRASNGSFSVSWAFSSVSHASFRFYAQQFYAGDKKCVPKQIERWLTPRGLAYWFMDDGSMKSKQSKGIVLNTQGFECSDVERLIGVLGARFALSANLRRQREGFQIYISGFSYENFVDLVDPFLIAEMRYKVPSARRTR